MKYPVFEKNRNKIILETNLTKKVFEIDRILENGLDKKVKKKSVWFLIILPYLLRCRFVT